MLNSIAHFFLKAIKSPEIQRKLLIIAVILAVFRIAAHIPAAGIDRQSLAVLFASSPLLSLLDVFAGGTLANFSIMALGLNPYINASIILQLLGYVIPSLEQLQKEGEYGQEKINQYTRFLTVPLAALQGFMMYSLLERGGIIGQLSPLATLSLIFTMTAGTVFAVWLGELISEYGFKNGVSFLIFVGIISRLPVVVGQSVSVFQTQDIFKVGMFLLLSVVIVGLIIFVNEAVRQIPIQYARRAAGNWANLPLRLNMAGVIPIIFAVSLVLLPYVASQFLSGLPNPTLANFASQLARFFAPDSVIYNLTYFLLVFGFTYFYTTVVFNPDKIAENLQKSGGFIPGIRPGSQTSKYLSFVLTRITTVGGIFLGLIAVLPSFFQSAIGVANLAIGGTGILIVVSVVLEVARELEGELSMKKYEGFLSS
jgi:preprotein translocase subunit SecY